MIELYVRLQSLLTVQREKGATAVEYGMIVALIAVGSIIGAQLGVRAGRRMPAAVMRGFIIIVGVTALLVFLLR